MCLKQAHILEFRQVEMGKSVASHSSLCFSNREYSDTAKEGNGAEAPPQP